jgi:glutathione S-transferase
MTTKIQFGYWDFRGRGQVIRHLLTYTGLDWEETVYTDAVKWFTSDKQSLDLDFPNLPYLIDGEFTLSESVAIARYVANRSGKTELLGKNFYDSAKVDEIFGVFEDLRTQFFKLYADKGYK